MSILGLLMCISCATEDKTAAAIAKINVDISVSRFDQEFGNAALDGIPALKNKYPYLFPEQYPDSIWVAKLQDTIQQELVEEVTKVFPDFKSETEALETLFKHIVYYFPNYTPPKVVTLISDRDYINRVVLTDSLLLLGLDNYLGTEHYFYSDIQRYIAFGLDKRYIAPNVASAFVKGVVSRSRNRSFLDRMIYYGKELYVLDKLLPSYDDADKIGYSPKKLNWAIENEEEIWRNFIENEFLYSNDNGLDARFLDPAPFSKFRLELDSESPGRVGRYIGWQIVRAFATENPEIQLNQLLRMPAEEIFKASNYKPRK